MIEPITDFFLGKAPLGVSRSGKWPGVRAEHLALFPECEVCGGKANLSAHHIKPFHTHPELELDPRNLITLCESKRLGLNCHLLIGHLGNFRRINPAVWADAETWRLKLTPP